MTRASAQEVEMSGDNRLPEAVKPRNKLAEDNYYRRTESHKIVVQLEKWVKLASSWSSDNKEDHGIMKEVIMPPTNVSMGDIMVWS